MLHPSPLCGAFITPSLYPWHQVVGVDMIISNAPTAIYIHIHLPLSAGFISCAKKGR